MEREKSDSHKAHRADSEDAEEDYEDGIHRRGELGAGTTGTHDLTDMMHGSESRTFGNCIFHFTQSGLMEFVNFSAACTG